MVVVQDEAAFDVEYNYTQLPDASTHIRLIRVRKAAEGEGVECEVTVWSRDEVPTYIGISYTWGDPGSITSIKISGMKLNVQTNCEYVLRQAFNFDPNKYYWVDAICINQRDTVEKSKQVAMMGDIYHAADHVLCCLGPHARDSEVLFRVMANRLKLLSDIVHEGLTSAADNTPVVWSPRTRREVLCFWRWFIHVKPSIYRQILEAVRCLINRPYFRRAWVVQEVALARNVFMCCGMDTWTTTHWRGLMCLIEFELNLKLKQRPSPITLDFPAWALCKFWRRGIERSMSESNLDIDLYYHHGFTEFALAQKKNYMSIAQLVEAMTQKECSDSRDRIYASLQLVDWRGFGAIEPTYESSTFQLGVDVVKHLAQETSNLQFISIVVGLVALLDLGLSREGSTGYSSFDPQFWPGNSICKDISTPQFSFRAQGVPVTSKILSQALVWYRPGFRPCCHSMPSFVCHCRGPKREAGNKDSTTRLPSFMRYYHHGSTYDDSEVEDFFSVLPDSINDWVIHLLTSVGQFAIIARRSSAKSYTIIGYMIYETTPSRENGSDFVVCSEPSDVLRLAIVAGAAMILRDKDDCSALAASIDGVEIFRSLHSTFAMKASWDDIRNRGDLDELRHSSTNVDIITARLEEHDAQTPTKSTSLSRGPASDTTAGSNS